LFKDTKLRYKLLFILFIPLVSLVIVSITALDTVENVTTNLTGSLYAESFLLSNLILNADRDMYQALDHLNQLIAAAEEGTGQEQSTAACEEEINQVFERISKVKKIFDENKDGFRNLRHNQSGKTIDANLSSFNTSFQKWSQLFFAINEQYTQGLINKEEMTAELGKIRFLFDEARGTLNELGELIQLYAEQEIGEQLSLVRKYEFYVSIFNSFILLCSLLLGLLLIKDITVSIRKDIGSSLARIATGDFRFKLDVKRNDEIGEIAKQINSTLEQVSSMVRKVINSSQQVNKAAHEISSANRDLSERTQEQASTLEEISTTMEEVATSIQQVSKNSSQADELSQTTLEAVQEGENSIKKTIEAMQEIADSSNEIAEIIKVVDDIAFQTNLLALNAAIEAARAGEHGRGFAVVAAEVRNLAGRTAQSAKKIEKLITNSVDRVERGNTLAYDSAQTLERIVENTKRTVDVIVEVAAAMREQSGSTQQIQASIEELNHVTQQNAAMVEEVTSSSQLMSAETEDLRDVLDRFKMEAEELTIDQGSIATDEIHSHSIKPKHTAMAKKLGTQDFNQDTLDSF